MFLHYISIIMIHVGLICEWSDRVHRDLYFGDLFRLYASLHLFLFEKVPAATIDKPKIKLAFNLTQSAN